MVSSSAKTVAAYLESLPAERRAVVSTVRDALRRAMPQGYEETMNWGMVTWEIPLSRYPETYNRQPLGYVALAAQKNNYAIYLMGVVTDSSQEQQLRAAYDSAGKKLDMGKSCLRFKRLDDLLLDEVMTLVSSISVEQYLEHYELSRGLR